MPANFIGDKLLSDIRETISTVRNMPGGETILAIPTRFDRIQQPVFRTCTFTGAWPKGGAKVVTFRNQTSTPNTVSATNIFAAVPAPASTANCAIAREGTEWYLIAAECS